MKARALLVTLVVVWSAAGLAAQKVTPASYTGQWHGRWTGDGYAYSAQLDLHATSDVEVKGMIHWTLAVSPREEEKSKIGAQATEFVRGTVDAKTGELHLKGYDKDDPQGVIDMDEYRLHLAGDGDVVSGITSDHDTWAGNLALRRLRVKKDASLSGTYTLYQLDNPGGAARGEIKIMQDGQMILITGDGWRADGKFNGNEGYYNWTFTDGRIGRTELKRNDDGTLNGLVHGSGLNWTYLAVASE